MKFEAWDLGLLCVFFSALAYITDEVEVVLLGLCLSDDQASTMLPDVAFVTCNAMCAIILIKVSFIELVQKW